MNHLLHFLNYIEPLTNVIFGIIGLIIFGVFVGGNKKK